MNQFYKTTQKISFLVLKNNGPIDPSTGKSDYIKLFTASFDYDNDKMNLPESLLNEESFSKILNMIFDDVLDYIKDKKLNESELSIGLILEFKKDVIDNALLLTTFNDIKQYGSKDIDPVLEFYKMTLKI